MDRNEPFAVVCLELLVWSTCLHFDTPDVIHQHNIIGIELADLVGSGPRVEPQQGYPAAIGLLPFRPLDEPLPLLHRVTTSGLGLFDPLQLEPSEVVDDPILMVSQPTKQQGELLEILVDCGWALARVQQPLLELDHISLAVACRWLVAECLDKGTEIVFLVLSLFRCPGEGLLFLIAVTQDRQERSTRFSRRSHRLGY
ncbi:hypothetical protein COCAGNCG_02394 [Aeromonas dhakensis]